MRSYYYFQRKNYTEAKILYSLFRCKKLRMEVQRKLNKNALNVIVIVIVIQNIVGFRLTKNTMRYEVKCEIKTREL